SPRLRSTQRWTVGPRTDPSAATAMLLSPHLSLEELAAAEVAARVGISNAPPPDVMGNLVRLAEGLERVRAALGNNAVHVTSGYRSPRLNQMVGGSRHSMHMQGLAADILCPVFGPPLQVCRAIARPSVRTDQVIHEFGKWRHVAVRPPWQSA